MAFIIFKHIDINGVSEKLFSFSGYETLDEAISSGAKLPNDSIKIAWAPEESSFQTFVALKNDGTPMPRYFDGEYKILSEIDKQLCGNKNTKGKITLLTELKCCDSCSDVITQFSEKYPNVEIEVIHNNDQRIK